MNFDKAMVKYKAQYGGGRPPLLTPAVKQSSTSGVPKVLLEEIIGILNRTVFKKVFGLQVCVLSSPAVPIIGIFE